MDAVIHKEYLLDGLCCAMCAEKMQKRIRKLVGVDSAGIDFTSQKLTLDIVDDHLLNEIMVQTNRIVTQYEPDIKVIEIAPVVPGEKTIFIQGINESHRENIEASIACIAGVKRTLLDAAAQKLVIEVENKERLPAIIRQAAQIICEIDSSIQISYTDKRYEEARENGWKQCLHQIGLYLGAALFIIGMIFEFSQAIELTIFLVAYALVGGEVVLQALRNISRGHIFDENFLMSVATIGAFCIGEYPEGVAVMLFYQVGEAFQRVAVGRSRKSISSIMDIRPDFANLKLDDVVRRVSPEEVCVGEYIVVKPGEKVPLDGVVEEGHSALDTSALTGESLPRDVEPGSDILSGSINKSGLLTVRVTKEFGESTVSKILDLVQNASGKKTPVENFITKFARYYTPIVVFAAIALAVLPPMFVLGAQFSDWLGRALVFLVVSCPCALVISIPLSFFGGIGGASKNGILIKGSNYLDALTHIDTIVFDKTGTLTEGKFRVTEIKTESGWTKGKLLYYAAYAESGSNHPIALSIRAAFNSDIDYAKITDYKEIAGKGITVNIDGKTVLAGNGRLLSDADIPYTAPEIIGTVTYIAVDGVFGGCIAISDESKPDSRQAIQELKAIGVRKAVMLTGDSRAVGEKIGNELGIDSVYAELLPGQKVEQLEAIEQKKHTKGTLVFVGDGINDPPVLARADVGIAMGGIGSDAAIEAADIVLMTDEPSKIVTAIQIAKKTRSIVWQNIIFALGVKAVVLILGAMGIATMWAAVFGDVGVAVIAILNAMRAMRIVR